MKKLLVSLLTLAAMAFTANAGTFKIHGDITGLDDRYQVILFNFENGGFRTDTIAAINGKFSYEGTCDGRQPRLFVISDRQERENFMKKSNGKSLAMYGNFMMRLFVHPQADITLTGAVEDFPILKITDPANPINNDCSEVMALGAKEQLEINRLHYIANEARWSGDKVAQDACEKRINELRDDISRKENTWIEGHPDSEYAAYLYTSTKMNSDSIDALKAMYSRFSPEVQQSEYGKTLAEKIQRMTEIVPGAAAPAFTMRDVISGNDISLSDFKGKYLIVDFWGSWCGPCRKSHPHLIQIYQRYKDKGLSIVGIAADREEDVIKKAASADGLLWPQINMYEVREGMPDISKAYNISAFPTKFLIGKDGKIIAKYVGDSSEIDSELEKLMGE